jgi:aspartate-semialdehyde dehydrogenase
MMNPKIPVAVIGATGAVGQRFIQLLDGHPTFEIVALGASDRSEGKTYAEAAHWILDTEIPKEIRDLRLAASHPQSLISNLQSPPKFVFSALPNDLAKDIEPAFAQAGMVVFSNASYYRMAQDVPLVIPEVNWQHLNLIKTQRQQRGWRGGIVCNTNCTVSGPSMSLRPLYDAFGVQRVFSVSMQALSGAGYPGVASLDGTENVIPFIKGEEEKLEAEARKLLGQLDGNKIDDAPFNVSAHCNRVPVIDGHMVTMSVELAQPATPAEVTQVLREFECEVTTGLPTAPKQPIIVRDEPDRPQPRKDRLAGGGRAAGMSCVVGRVRAEPLFGERGVKFMTLAHNTIRGAAGGSILNAELFVKMEL